jgi:hypothetical protein
MDIINFIRKQLHWLKGSGDNEIGGASSKKLTDFFCFALVGICVIGWAIWAYIHNNWDLLLGVLGIIGGYGLGALGINSNEKIKLKNKDEQP